MEKEIKQHKKGYKFRIGPMVFVVQGYDAKMKKYECRLWDSDNLYYFTAQQISRKR